MAKKSFDLRKIKDFLVDKGERLALGVCLLLGGGLLAYGIMIGASNSGKDYHTPINNEAIRLDAQRDGAKPGPKEDIASKLKKPGVGWVREDPLAYHAAPWFWLVESAKSRRRMPRVFP